MPRGAMSARSDDGDDVETLSEAEYQKLKRQYQNAVRDKELYTQESQDQIRKQRDEIEKLNKEKEEILKDLRLIEGQSHQTKDDRNTETLGDLARRKDSLEEEINKEKEKQEEVDAEIREQRKKNREQQKNMGGANQSGAHTKQTQKNISTLENRLDQQLKKFNNYCKENEKLRKEIDSLRVDRRRFDDLYKKLSEEQEKTQQEIGEIIDSSTQAYDQRDDAQSKMVALKERSDKDKQQHDAEMKELVRILDHDQNLREFMTRKGRPREEDPQLVAWREKKERLEYEKKKASQTDSVDSYESAYRRIKEIKNEEDMDILVEKFIETEDRNFALFNYVNEQNNQIEKLQEDIEDIKHEIAKFEAQGMEMEEDRKDILKKLEEKQTAAARAGDDAEEKNKGVCKILDQVRAGIESLFTKINCDPTFIDDMLGAQQGVTNQNMLQHLGEIERQVNMLMLCYFYQMRENDPDDYYRKKPSLIAPLPAPTSTQPTVAPPTVGDEYDSDGSNISDEENSRPMNHDELLRKANKSVRKRESAARKEGFKYDLSDVKKKDKKKY